MPLGWVVGALVAVAGADGGALPPSADCSWAAVRQDQKVDYRALERLTARGCDLNAEDEKGNTLLSLSVEDGQTKLALWLIDHGVDVRRHDRWKSTILHTLANAESPESVRLVEPLVRHGADVNALDETGATPLDDALAATVRAAPHRCVDTLPGGDVSGCWIDNARMVRALLAHGADPNRPDRLGTRPLWRAIHNDDLDEVKALLEAGAHPGGRDVNGETIWEVQQHPDLRIVGYLLAHGADPNERDGYGDGPLQAISFGWYPLDRASPADRLAVARLLLAHHADVRGVGHRGETPLHAAASAGFTELAQLLIAAGADPNAVDDERRTPLHLAAWQGWDDTVAFLLDKGAKPALGDRDGLTSLHWLARGAPNHRMRSDRARTIRRLLAGGVAIDALDRDTRTPLWHAVAFDSEMVDLLLAAGADRRKVGPRGAAVLHLAAYRDDDNLAWRLPAMGVNPAVRDVDGRTPLHWAAFFGRMHAVARLAVIPRADLGIIDSAGRTPLDWAIAACQREPAALLIRLGARATATDWRARLDACPPERPEPPPLDEHLHRAAQRGADVKPLLDAGLPVDGRDKRGRTPLHWAAEFVPHTKTLEELLHRGARVDAPDRDGETPLHAAARALNTKAVAVLLKAGADPNAPNDRGETPLFLVVPLHSEAFDCYRRLIDGGAKLTARDRLGRTPLLAVFDVERHDDGGREAAELFVCRGADPDARDAFGWGTEEIARLRGWQDTRAARCPSATPNAAGGGR